jgi:hypothetical protein
MFVAIRLLTCGSTAVALEIHVSPNGDDAHTGTQASPLNTLHAAQRLARTQAGREPVMVIVQDGTYYLEKPLILTHEDSGTMDLPVTYRAAHEAKAILSGGMPLELEWERYRDGIFQAKTPDDIELDQLFVNGTRQLMARYPNYDPRKTDVPYRGSAADAISSERVATWANPVGGYIHAMHQHQWGGFSYEITGKNAKGELTYEGGWQNNRPAGMHRDFRMVENVFEELDSPGEWFHNRQTSTLYFYPPQDVDVRQMTVEGVRLASLVELRGSQDQPVRFVTFDGFTMRHTARTFMQNKEPLLRSDWTIYRGGTVMLEGTEDCGLTNTFIDQPGANGVFVNNYNRRVRLAGLHIFDCGASGVAFVGDPQAVRNPVFQYGNPHDLAAVDRTPGPQTDNYPMECVLEDSLIHEVGTVEKQGAGVQISMSRRITVRHCSIYDTSRAGINISEGTWGGHLIEGCDVFRTVQETGDHGSFNSWGRDRFWVPDTAVTAREVEPAPDLPFLDAIEPTTIRRSRWRCDHGWDIDLDDGSSNYIITNNMLLNGGLKLREGYRRIATNNIIVNNTLHPHVWYPDSGDIFTGNIVMRAYQPAIMSDGKWGKEINRNLFASNQRDRLRFAANGTDANSVVGNPHFADPAGGDFTVTNTELAKAIGFENFSMHEFGVQKPSLKAIAATPVFPKVDIQIDPREQTAGSPRSPVEWLGATLRQPRGEELSAFGVSFETKGLAIESMDEDSSLGGPKGLKVGDLILSVNGMAVASREDLRKAVSGAKENTLQFRIVRKQTEQIVELKVERN